MKVRHSLIRLHKWQADEKRKQLAKLQALRSDLLGKAAMLDASVAREQVVVSATQGGDSDLAFAYAPFAHVAIRQRENLLRSITAVELSVADEEDAVAEAYKALKRHEIAAATQELRETSERNRKAQIVSDEQALQSHTRANRAL